MQETQETQVPSLGWEDPLEEEMATCSSILAGKFHGQRSLVGYRPWGHRKLDTTEGLSTHISSLLDVPLSPTTPLGCHSELS